MPREMRATLLAAALPCGGLRNLLDILAIAITLLALIAISPLHSSAAGASGTSAKAAAQNPPQTQVGDLYGIIVGISQYRDPSIPALQFAVKDARDVGEFFKSQSQYYKKTVIRVLLNQDATHREVQKALYYDLMKAGKNDTVVVFLSGHGAGDPKRPGEFFFITYDSDAEFLEASAVNMTGLRFLKSLDSQRIVLIADACHSGAFSYFRAKNAEPALKQLIQDFSNSTGRLIITSSKPDEYSLEDPLLDNGIFTHYLLKGLRGEADIHKNGIVTVNQAYDYAYTHTKEASKGVQHPQMEGSLVGPFPLAFLPKVAAIPSGQDSHVDQGLQRILKELEDVKARLATPQPPASSPQAEAVSDQGLQRILKELEDVKAKLATPQPPAMRPQAEAVSDQGLQRILKELEELKMRQSAPQPQAPKPSADALSEQDFQRLRKEFEDLKASLASPRPPPSKPSAEEVSEQELQRLRKELEELKMRQAAPQPPPPKRPAETTRSSGSSRGSTDTGSRSEPSSEPAAIKEDPQPGDSWGGKRGRAWEMDTARGSRSETSSGAAAEKLDNKSVDSWGGKRGRPFGFDAWQ